jgi:hypothetical protein
MANFILSASSPISTDCWSTFDDMSPTKSPFRPAGPRVTVWSLFALLLAFISLHPVEGTDCATFIKNTQIPHVCRILHNNLPYFDSQRNHAARLAWTAMWANAPVSPVHARRHALRGSQAWATPGWTVYLASNKQGC